MIFLETLRSHLTYDSYHHQHSSSADCFTKIKRRGRGGLASGVFYLTSLKMMIMVFSTPISVSTQSSSSSPYRFLTPYLPVRTFFTRKKFLIPCLSNHESRDGRSNDNQSDDNLRRKILIFFSAATILFPISSSLAKTKGKNPYDEMRLLEQNKRIQRENNAPDDFPSFVREGFEVKVVTSENYVKRNSGLIYRDFEVGKGDCPEDGQQVMFHYVGYNESGRRIDSTYIQGAPARIRMGTNALVPGFEEGIRDMRPGGKRRIIIPPELGPPVGPSTFFSSKQFEVFDVELLSIQQCQRRSIAFYSDFVCS